QASVQCKLRLVSLRSDARKQSQLVDRERSTRSLSRNCLLLVLRLRTRGYESVSWLRSRWLYHFRQALRGNLHEGTEWNAIIKCAYVARLHPNAAVTGRPTDLLLLRSPMN